MSITRAAAARTLILYLLMGIGVPALTYLPRAFIVAGDATATAQRITDNVLTYRLLVLGDLASMIFFLLLAWSLYQMLEDVDRTWARLLVLFVVVSVGLGLIEVILLMAPFVVQALSGFSRLQLDALTLGAFRLRNIVLQIDEAFWGLWLFPFGVLAIKSGVIPKVVGGFLITGCFAWLAMSFTSIAAVHSPVVDRIAFLLAQPGELSMLLWLAYRAIRPFRAADARVAYAR